MSIPLTVFFEILTLIISIGAVYVAITTRVTRLEERMEERQKAMEREQHMIIKKIDQLQQTMGEVLIKLENKANR